MRPNQLPIKLDMLCWCFWPLPHAHYRQCNGAQRGHNPYEATEARAILAFRSTYWYHQLRLHTSVKAHVRLVTYPAEDSGNEGRKAT